MIRINDFLIAMESIERDFETASFIHNSRNALYESCDIPKFANQMEKSNVLTALCDQLSSMEGNGSPHVGNKVCDMLRRINDDGCKRIGQLPVVCEDIIEIYADYLEDYNSNINAICSSMLSALLDIESISECDIIVSEAIDKLHDLTNAAKRQIVRTSLDIYNVPTNELFVARTFPYKVYDEVYLKDKIYPMAKCMATSIETCNDQISSLQKCMTNVLSELRYRENAIDSQCQQHPHLCKYLNQFLYNANRDFLSVMKFLQYAAIRKVNTLEHNIKCCSELSNRLNFIVNAYPAATVILKEASDTDIIRTDDDIALGKRLLDGNSDAYHELAKNSYDFHKSLLLQIFGSNEEPDNTVNKFVDGHAYDQDPYNSILELTTLIGAGLDKMAAMATDNIIVVDDIIEASGLSITLDAQRHDKIKMLEDTQKYDSATTTEMSGNIDIYREILHEIKDYPRNMKIIAKSISDTYKKLGILRGQLDLNLNGEFKNIRAVVELKQYLISLDEEFINLAQMISSAMMNRLRKIVVDAEKISVHIEQERIVPFGMQTYEDVDYEVLASEIMLEYQKDYTDILMKSMHDAFMNAWTKKTFHKEYITEAEATIGTTNTTDTTAGTNNAAAAKNTGEQKQNIQNRLQALKDAIRKQFEEMLNKFKANINKMMITQADNSKVSYAAWIDANADALLNRSYTNVKLEILPYEKGMPFDKLLTDVQQFQGQVSGIKASEANAMKTDAAVFRRLFSTKGNIQLTDDMDLAQCKSTVSDALLKYYKVGNEPLAVQSYSDAALKPLVTDMVNFCKNYFGGQQEQLTTALNNISNALQTSANGYIKEETDYIMSMVDRIIMEETDEEKGTSTAPKVSTVDNNNTSSSNTGNNQSNGESMSLTKMMDAIQAGSVVYSGTVCNAVRDRVVDYYKALQSLLPKQQNS